jgi:micrococcal nuclease
VYEYRARLLQVVDGDTVDVLLDLGLGIHREERLRLARIDAPEVRGAEAAQGRAASLRLRVLLGTAVDGWLLVRTIKDKREKYGRYLAEMIAPQGDGTAVNASDALLAEGLATLYVG